MKTLSSTFVATIVILVVWSCFQVQNIKFVDRDGNVCGCMVNKELPSLDQCKEVDDFDTVITVSKCK